MDAKGFGELEELWGVGRGLGWVHDSRAGDDRMNTIGLDRAARRGVGGTI